MPSTSAAAETREILHAARAILASDHFVYISGDHGSGWIDKDSIFVDLRHTARLGELLAAATGDLGAAARWWTAAERRHPSINPVMMPEAGERDCRRGGEAER